MKTEVYVVTSDFLANKSGAGEYTALNVPRVFGTYMRARRYIKKFTKSWKNAPTLQRTVTPLHVINSVGQRYDEYQPIAIATFKGVALFRDTPMEIWFAIYKAKI